MTIEQREQSFKEKVQQMPYPKPLLDEFFEYWSEPTPGGKKMRYELEKTWDLNRRILRWQRTNESKPNFKLIAPAKMEYKENKPVVPTNEAEALDQLLNKYQQHPTSVPFSEFGKWYDFMKKERLLKPLTKMEIEQLQKIYEGDNGKCRCACVQMTFDGYVNSGFTFGKVFQLRQKLA